MPFCDAPVVVVYNIYVMAMTLHEIEAQLDQLQVSPQRDKSQAQIRQLRQALTQRLRQIKAQAMQFEATNDRYLLIFDSTNRYAKMAGNSVLFYTQLLADRLRRRYNIQVDTDTYSVSEEGIVSIRALDALEQALASINVLPDPKLSTEELHVFRLSRPYSKAEIAKLRERVVSDTSRMATLIMPKMPLPDLFRQISELERLVFFGTKHCRDTFARDYLTQGVVTSVTEMVAAYLAMAQGQPHQLLAWTIKLERQMVSVSNLRLMKQADVGKIVDLAVAIERSVERECRRSASRAGKAEPTVPTDQQSPTLLPQGDGGL